MKVQQLINSRGNATANQFIITDGNTITFQSYNSIIAVMKNYPQLNITFGRDWDYSRTTMKHLNTFLKDYCNLDIQGANNIRKAIKRGHTTSYGLQIDVVYDSEMQ